MEYRRRRRVAHEDAAQRMLRHLEDSEDLKVGIPSCRVKLFKIFRQGENEVCIASLARWDTQLKGLAELERRWQGMMQEVKLLSEKQEVLKGMVEDKIRLQSKATEQHYEKIFEEMRREFGEKKSKEALLLVQKNIS